MEVVLVCPLSKIRALAVISKVTKKLNNYLGERNIV